MAELIVVGVVMMRSVPVHVEVALPISDCMLVALAVPLPGGKGGHVGLVAVSMPTCSKTPRGGDITSGDWRCCRLWALGETQLIP